ncbi:interferon-induced protein with tetratricopeptide repeats 2-like [Sorex araneus]|uniref:interferon-induced protein with tetratricopeptide repeats 2-like n=1 Tax=Sorex araneus TaxID=42254 RepID=UPI002433BD7B|nr:interferon-induced protein with tetratricopeptide repeats 2-like [Sorex araneus]
MFQNFQRRISLASFFPTEAIANMSETNSSLKQSLSQLKCHFTWNFKEKDIPEDLEERLHEQIEFSNSASKGTMYNMLAYIKHLRGKDEDALEYLKQAEESIQQEHCDKAEVRNLVTWGNYAWVNYHLGRLPEAQAYVDKVKQVCKKFSSPYRIECPELENEEGWTRLKCGGLQTERAMVCFEKALEKHPRDPESTSGLAIAVYRVSDSQTPVDVTDSLHKAIKLNPDNHYLKVVLALTRQRMKEGDEGESLVEEALEKAPKDPEVVEAATKFYKRKGDSEKTSELTQKNLTRQHYYKGYIYRGEVLRKSNMMSSDELNELIKKAIDHLKKAHEMDENLPCVCLYLGELYSRVGEHEEAERYFQEELGKAQTPIAKQRFHLHYGNVQLENNQTEKAIHHYMEGCSFWSKRKLVTEAGLDFGSLIGILI